MRNIAFVITLYMLSMFSIHAQHSYYKLDREGGTLVSIQNQTTLSELEYEFEETLVFDSMGEYYDNRNSSANRLIIEIRNTNLFDQDKINQNVVPYNQAYQIVFKKVKREDVFSTINLLDYNQIKYIVIESHQELSYEELIQKFQNIEISDTIQLIFIHSMLN